MPSWAPPRVHGSQERFRAGCTSPTSRLPMKTLQCISHICDTLPHRHEDTGGRAQPETRIMDGLGESAPTYANVPCRLLMRFVALAARLHQACSIPLSRASLWPSPISVFCSHPVLTLFRLLACLRYLSLRNHFTRPCSTRLRMADLYLRIGPNARNARGMGIPTIPWISIVLDGTRASLTVSYSSRMFSRVLLTLHNYR